MSAITSDAMSAMRAAHTQGLHTSWLGNRVYRVGSLSEWQVRALQKLASFGSLVPNWDSYGSRPISDSVIDVATGLVSQVNVENAPTPRIIPVSGGGVQLGWEKGQREVEIEVHPDSSVEVLISENGIPLAESQARSLSASVVERLLSWLDGH